MLNDQLEEFEPHGRVVGKVLVYSDLNHAREDGG